MLWAALQDLGKLTLTLPLAAAIAAWLLAGGERRAAATWLLLLSSALMAVGISKIAYLGWGIGIPALDFKAISGHAAGVTAVYPVLSYQLLRRLAPRAAPLGASLGFLLGALVACALVVNAEHTVVEACAGWLVGGIAGACTLASTRGAAVPGILAGPFCALLAFCTASWAMQRAQVGAWMVKVALALSGNSQPFHWGSCG